MGGIRKAKAPALRRTEAVYLNKVVVTLVDRCNPSQIDKGTFFQITSVTLNLLLDHIYSEL